MQPPEPTHKLTIMEELDKTNALSCLQIETLVYACQVSYLFIVRHSFFTYIASHVSFVWQRHLHHLPTGARAGFFIGDGAGVGKGRTIAGLIWEIWQQGRHKAL